MRIFNSLTRQIEELKPINPPKVGVYTCGPTVYSFVTIGNWRTYVLGDFVVRSLKFLGYQPTYIMNITDVGHLTGDNLGDADTGEDRLEKASAKEGKTAWEIADYYTQDFLAGYKDLNLTQPQVFCKATDHITEQIEAVKAIETRGFSYKISDGIYFDTTAYELAGNTYGELSNLTEIKAGARVEENLEKKNPRDFALWKFSPPLAGQSGKASRQMEWESPWGIGFPGWHIECSAMSQKYLGEQFDLHLGGEDLRSTHHPNEIAQAEAATGKKPFVKYWVHGAFLTVDGGRMGKSLGNAHTLSDLVSKGYEPMDLKYFFLFGHYGRPLNFTWEVLKAAREARLKLSQLLSQFRQEQDRTVLSPEKLIKVDEFRKKFKASIEDNLNMSQALAVVWEVAKSNIPGGDKYDLILEMDEVLGLKITDIGIPFGSTQGKQMTDIQIPEEIQNLLRRREEMRRNGDYGGADRIRGEIESRGYRVKDSVSGSQLVKLSD